MCVPWTLWTAILPGFCRMNACRSGYSWISLKSGQERSYSCKELLLKYNKYSSSGIELDTIPQEQQ